MKIIRTDRSDKLLKISRPLLASFLLFNSISDVLAEESPSIAGVEQKEAKTKAKKICCKTQTPQPSPPITLETLEVKGKVGILHSGLKVVDTFDVNKKLTTSYRSH